MIEGYAEGRAPIGLEIRRPTGGVIRYRLKADPDIIANLRRELKRRSADTYAMEAPPPTLDEADRIVREAESLGVPFEGRSFTEVADDVAGLGTGTREAIVPDQGPTVEPAKARIEIYNDDGVIVILPTKRSAEAAAPPPPGTPASNACRAFVVRRLRLLFRGPFAPDDDVAVVEDFGRFILRYLVDQQAQGLDDPLHSLAGQVARRGLLLRVARGGQSQRENEACDS